MKEIEEKEKIVIARPVACRPRFSNLKTFSDLLSGATNTSTSASFTETAVAVIRPTTVRFKPISSIDLVGVAETHDDSSACHSSKKQALESDPRCNVIYKPIAKFVSRATVSLLSNLGGNGIAPAQEVGEVGDSIRPSKQLTHQTDATLEAHHDFPTWLEQRENAPIVGNSADTKSSFLSNSRDHRPSHDGHNWRKYGQKQVKGSEFPRSYYKCTYPNCPVKKKVEKSLDGQIAEIVYKGEHNHLKPHPPNHTPSDGHAQTPACDATRKEIVKAHEGRSEHQDVTDSSNQSTFSGTLPNNYPVTSAACNAGPSTSNNSMALSEECEDASEFVEAEGGDFRSKRRKPDSQLLGESIVGEAISDPQIVVQNNTGIVGDGFRWRKYGQKVVKGKMFPRSYYRCTSPDCNVRKYVERTFEDPGTFITTYEGKHNHAMPMKCKKAEASKTSIRN